MGTPIGKERVSVNAGTAVIDWLLERLLVIPQSLTR